MNKTATQTSPEDVDARWHDLVQRIDHHVQGKMGKVMGGISPVQTALVYLDWCGHLAMSPGKQMDVARSTLTDIQHTVLSWMQPPSAEKTPDHRFASPSWQAWPFRTMADSLQLAERFWDRATHGVPGLNHRHEDVAAFAARQWVDVFSPSNVPWLNPEVIQATRQEQGANLARGALNFIDDTLRTSKKLPPAGVDQFKVGHNVAITPGKVVFKNDLIELIQYSPSTDKVHAEPILIVPAWIMKYYILDLSPQNSLVKFLVDQGHTVFMISWKNPTQADRDKGMETYRTDGVMAAIDTISQIVPERPIHAAGYCLGGTLLQIAAATMGRDHDARLASMTLFAAQSDFSEAGELLLFINDSEVNLIEAMMAEQGMLTGQQMAGTFQLLHSNDLIWSRALKDYMLGHRDAPNDLMAWNADTTRMPARMHSEYLHQLFLHNDLANGHYEVNGAPIWFTDIHVPCFAVGTLTDHVAPWKSVYKLHMHPLDITFVLTSGGHNAGVVSEPGHPHRHFQLMRRAADGEYIAPEHWQAEAPNQQGSWWPAWHQWLVSLSSGLVAAPQMGLPGARRKLQDAPGEYVLG
jgi:polyhydroxyalkanoate synthase